MYHCNCPGAVGSIYFLREMVKVKTYDDGRCSLCNHYAVYIKPEQVRAPLGDDDYYTSDILGFGHEPAFVTTSLHNSRRK